MQLPGFWGIPRESSLVFCQNSPVSLASNRLTRRKSGPQAVQAYGVAAGRSRILNVESVNIFLQQAKQREVESGQSGLLALKRSDRIKGQEKRLERFLDL